MSMTLITSLMVAIISGFLIGWLLRNKRIAALESHLSNYKKKLLKSEMELSNLEAYFKHINNGQPKIQETKRKLRRNGNA